MCIITIHEFWWAAMCTSGVIAYDCKHCMGSLFAIHCARRHWSLTQIRGTFLLNWTTRENFTTTFLHLENVPLSWNYSLKWKELGYMRNDFDPPAVANLSTPKKTIGLVGLSNCEWIIQGYYRRKVSPPGFEPATYRSRKWFTIHSASQPPRLNSAVSSISLISY